MRRTTRTQSGVKRGGTTFKPTALRVIEGGKPINPNEIMPPIGCKKPTFLPPEASKVWDEFYPKLETLGLITEIDVHVFANYCILVGRMVADPYLFTATEMIQLRLIAASFGMTPAARATGLGAPKPEEKKTRKTDVR